MNDLLGQLIKIESPERQNALTSAKLQSGAGPIEKRKVFFHRWCIYYVTLYLPIMERLERELPDTRIVMRGSLSWFLHYYDPSFDHDNVDAQGQLVGWFHYLNELNVRNFKSADMNSWYQAVSDHIQKFFDRFEIDNPEKVAMLPQNIDLSIYVDIDQSEDQDHVVYTKIGDIFIEEVETTFKHISRHSLKTIDKQTGQAITKESLRLPSDRNSIYMSGERDKSRLEIFKGQYVAICVNAEGDKSYLEYRDEVCGNGYLLLWATIHLVDRTFVEHQSRLLVDNKLIPRRSAKGADLKIYNAFGLYYQYVLLKSNYANRVTTKAIDVDTLRYEALFRNINDKDKGEIFKFIGQSHVDMFNSWLDRANDVYFDSIYQYENIVTTIQRLILGLKDQVCDSDDHIQNILDSFQVEGCLEKYDAYMMRLIGPIINSVIIYINQELQNLLKNTTEFNDVFSDANLFIVGGDAFTRYIPDTKISDIDTKLYLTLKKDRVVKIDEVIELIQDYIAPILSYCVIQLNNWSDRFEIFSQQPLDAKFRVRGHDELTLSSGFYLLSIDMRYPFRPAINNFNKVKYELAVFDMSIQLKNVKSGDITLFPSDHDITLIATDEDYDYSPNVKHNLPVASKLFLRKDIENRFNGESLLSRLLSNKIPKDVIRYKQLMSDELKVDTTNRCDNRLIEELVNENKLKSDESQRYTAVMYMDSSQNSVNFKSPFQVDDQYIEMLVNKKKGKIAKCRLKLKKKLGKKKTKVINDQIQQHTQDLETISMFDKVDNKEEDDEDSDDSEVDEEVDDEVVEVEDVEVEEVDLDEVEDVELAIQPRDTNTRQQKRKRTTTDDPRQLSLKRQRGDMLTSQLLLRILSYGIGITNDYKCTSYDVEHMTQYADFQYFGVFVGMTRSPEHTLTSYPYDIHGSYGFMEGGYNIIPSMKVLCGHIFDAAKNAINSQGADKRSLNFPNILTDPNAVMDVKLMKYPVITVPDGKPLNNNEYGVIVQSTTNAQRATFLPGVYASESDEFIRTKLLEKANIPSGESVVWYMYTTDRMAMPVRTVYADRDSVGLISNALACNFLQFISTVITNTPPYVPYSVGVDGISKPDVTENIRNSGTISDIVRIIERLCPYQASYSDMLQEVIINGVQYHFQLYNDNQVGMRQAITFILPLLNDELKHQIKTHLYDQLDQMEPAFELVEALYALRVVDGDHQELVQMINSLRTPEHIFELNWQAQIVGKEGEMYNQKRSELQTILQNYIQENRNNINTLETNEVAVTFEACTALGAQVGSDIVSLLLPELMRRCDFERGLFKFLNGTSRIDISGHVYRGIINLI